MEACVEDLGFGHTSGLARRVADRCSEVLDMGRSPDSMLAMRAIVTDFIGGDDVWFTQLDLQEPSATFVQAGPHFEVDRDLGTTLATWGPRHPAVLSYLTTHDDGRPRRVSDVLSSQEWQGSRVFSEGFRAHRARHQLSSVTSFTASRGRGWIVTREQFDFTPQVVEVAAQLLPVLVVLERSVAPVETTPTSALTELTPREQQLLHLLSEGMTARLMGRQLGISERTVDKHLEHLYRKLGSNDRLSAVLLAQQRGLLRVWPRSADESGRVSVP
jgi:DNA-binding CsgD family transcriptional regulator